jgi:hypothetical protein
MNASSALNAALAFCASSYSVKENSATVPGTVTIQDKPQKLVQVKRTPKAKAPSAPSCNGSEPKAEVAKSTFTLPEKGSLGAHGFMVAMRNAGKRTVDGKVIFDSNKVREDKIRAIAAFVGYDVAGDYGSQELGAMMAAKREIRPVDTSGPSLAEERSAKRSALGYVHGMPDNQSKAMLDLLAREKLAAEALITHEKASQNAELSQEARTLAAGLAAVEHARLVSIREDIKRMVG